MTAIGPQAGTGGVEGDPVAGPALAAHVALTTGAHNLAALLAAKQDAATAATDAELAAGLAGKSNTGHTHPQTDVTGLVAALGAKQDASTAATDGELAAESTARASADTTLTAAAAAAQATADAALPKAGGTMTGAIVLAADPVASLNPATKQWTLAQIAALINGAPGALDTLNEIAVQLAADETGASALAATVAGKLTATANLSDLVNAVTARTNLGLGTAATHPVGDFDLAGAAAAAQAASQPVDSDLTAIAALTTTSYGRAFLALADAAAGRTALGLGTAATHAHGDYDLAGAAAAAQAASQPLDSDLTAIALLSTTAFGRSLLEAADAAAGRTLLAAAADTVDAAAGVGSLRTIGTGALQAAAGNDSRLSDARTPTAHATSHKTGGTDAIKLNELAAPTADVALNAHKLTGLAASTANGDAVRHEDSRLSDARAPTAHKSTHEPGGTDAMAVDASAATGSLRTLGTGAAQAAAGNDARLSDTRTPTDGSVTAAKVNAALKPSGSAVAADESLRALGTTASTAAAGNDSRLSDARTPTAHTHPQSDITGLVAALAAASGYYITPLRATGRATAAISAAPKYFCSGGADITSVGIGASNVFLMRILAADLAVAGMTTKLRVTFLIHAGTSPACNVTCSLYAVTTGANLTLGAAVASSGVTITAPTNDVTPGASADFDLPTDGIYALGYTLSAVPANGLAVHGALQYHHV